MGWVKFVWCAVSFKWLTKTTATPSSSLWKPPCDWLTAFFHFRHLYTNDLFTHYHDNQITKCKSSRPYSGSYSIESYVSRCITYFFLLSDCGSLGKYVEEFNLYFTRKVGPTDHDISCMLTVFLNIRCYILLKGRVKLYFSMKCII